MGRMEGKVALVTGAGSGLGARIARRFREEGALLLVNDLRPEAAEKVAAEVGGRSLPADVSDSGAIRELFAAVARDPGRLDVLVNNAGYGGAEGNPGIARAFEAVLQAQDDAHREGRPIDVHLDATMNTSDEDWQRMLDVHLNGTFYCCREALKIMAPQMSGAIVNMGSLMGTTGMAGVAAYAAAKAGILGLTRVLAREVVTRNIRVNAVAPGFIETPLTEPLAAIRHRLETQTPMRRLGDPDDVAWAVVYLACDESKFVTGQVLAPNGGWDMSQ